MGKMYILSIIGACKKVLNISYVYHFTEVDKTLSKCPLRQSHHFQEAGNNDDITPMVELKFFKSWEQPQSLGDFPRIRSRVYTYTWL